METWMYAKTFKFDEFFIGDAKLKEGQSTLKTKISLKTCVYEILVIP